MEYNHLQQGMYAMPYYMAHPYPMFMENDNDDERDMEKLMSMFPKTARVIQPMVEDECDRMEYEGSLMFHEYPDRVMTEQIIESICQRIHAARLKEESTEQQVFATQNKNHSGNRFGEGLRDLVSVMLFEEMHRRRCRHRRCRRWW